MVTGRRLAVLAFLASALVTSCKLTEVTVANGIPMLVVQGVLSRTQSEQFVVVEWSLTGSAARGPRPEMIPPDSPQLPVSGATVTLTHLTGPCADSSVVFPEVAKTPGVYGSDRLCPLEPGDRVGLRVAVDSDTVSGVTRMPSVKRVIVSVGPDSAVVAAQRLDFNRDHDTLHIAARARAARGLQLEVRQAARPDQVAIALFVDSLGVAVAGNLVNPFEGDSGETIFRAGRAYLVTVALADTNYYDFLRSRNNPFSGQGFINHLTGGIGVFGSVDARTDTLRVVADIDDPREGAYHLTGTLDGTPVDLHLALYLDPLAPGPGFSAFTTGSWVDGPLDTSVDGRFAGDTLLATLQEPPDTTGPRYDFQGPRSSQGTAFDLTVSRDGVPVGTVHARQTSGPGG